MMNPYFQDEQFPDFHAKLMSDLNLIKLPDLEVWKTHLMDYFNSGGIATNAFGYKQISRYTIMNNP